MNSKPAHTIVPHNSVINTGYQRKELMMHCLMYGVNMYNEISELLS